MFELKAVKLIVFVCLCFPQLPLPSNTKTGIYKNNLDQMLKEINNNKKYVMNFTPVTFFFFFLIELL